MDEYICNHKSEYCMGCDHAIGHEPIYVTPFKETCVTNRGVCQTPRKEVQCILINK